MGDEERPAKIDETRTLATDDEGTAVETGQDGDTDGDTDEGAEDGQGDEPKDEEE